MRKALCPSPAAHQRHRRDRKAGRPVDCPDPEACRIAYNAYARDRRRDPVKAEPKPCPSPAAHQRHKQDEKAGRPVDCVDPEACRAAYNAYMRERRRVLAGAKPKRQVVPCPSYAAYQRHRKDLKAGRPVDCADPDGCRAANNDYHAARRRVASIPIIPYTG